MRDVCRVCVCAHGSSHTPIGCIGPEEDRDGVGLVVVGGCESTGTQGGDDCGLVGVALAGGEALDGADRHALIGEPVLFAPGGQCGEQAPENMSRISPRMAADLLEVDGFDRIAASEELVQPVAEAQLAHASTVIAAGPE